MLLAVGELAQNYKLFHGLFSTNQGMHQHQPGTVLSRSQDAGVASLAPVFMIRGERVERSSRFYPGALRFADKLAEHFP
jgi:hypothetical protein